MHQFVQTEHRLCDITTCSANPNGRPTTKEVLERELVICLPCHKLGGSADGVSLSMGAPLGEPGGGGGPPCWGPRRLWKEGSRDGNLSIWGLCWDNLGWAHLLGLQHMAEGALEMECLSPWELCEGNLEGASSWGPWRIFRKVSVDGHLYTGAPVLGNLEEGLSIRDFESKKGSGDGHLFL